MNNCDLILHFVDKYITEKEKEKNILLQQKLEQQKQMQSKNNVKTNKKL